MSKTTMYIPKMIKSDNVNKYFLFLPLDSGSHPLFSFCFLLLFF